MSGLPALVGDFGFQKLPYRKTDDVAKLDALPTRKTKHAVPSRLCSLSTRCDLRKRGKCGDLHCSIAAAHMSNRRPQ
jgi:hypothetical protein